jgi:superfamily II DNA helicase RecQ
MQVGTARLKVPFGSEVRVQGVTVELAAPGTNDGSLGPTEKYESALRVWRSEAAKQAAVPAYVVLNDSELVGIASSRPKTLAELARCKGVGSGPAGALGRRAPGRARRCRRRRGERDCSAAMAPLPTPALP